MKNLERESSAQWEESRVNQIQSGILPLEHKREQEIDQLKYELQELSERLNSDEVKRLLFSEKGGEMEVGNQMVELQRKQIPNIFKGISFESPYLDTHNIQQEDHSCQLACLSNVLKAFGFNEGINEEQIAEAIGKSGKIANIWSKELSDFLEKQGLKVYELKHTLEAIEALMRGEKIILSLTPPKYPQPHAIVISGIKIDHGSIVFYINDPQYKNYAETMRLDDIIDIIIPYSFNKIAFPNWSISRAD